EEFGFSCSLKMVDKFQYQAPYKDVGSENEMCAILVGEYNGEIKANPKEIADWKWVDIDKLQDDFRKNPGRYTPWSKIGLKRYLKIKEEALRNRKELDLFLKETAKTVDPIIQELLELYIDKKFHKLINYQIFTGKTVVDGEILDILFEQRGREEEPYIVKNRYHKITNQKYYEMIGKKTAALAQSCCEVGGICAGATKTIRGLKELWI
ncbi:unnamed protein product, partial [marine sediment metagenome]